MTYIYIYIWYHNQYSSVVHFVSDFKMANTNIVILPLLRQYFKLGFNTTSVAGKTHTGEHRKVMHLHKPVFHSKSIKTGFKIFFQIGTDLSVSASLLNYTNCLAE